METCKKNLLFIYLGVSDVSSASDTISTSQPLSVSHTIDSSGDIFELGLFFPDPGNSPNFYIGMWYKQVSPRTIVWVENRECPTLRGTSNYILKISDGNLILYDNFTATALWSTGLNSSSGKDVQAVLLDNGNLVLRDGPTSSVVVLWQSFDHPSDHWLPGAKIWFNNIKFGSQGLTSWKSFIDPSPGRYSLQVDPNIKHSLITVWNGSKSYWSSGPWDDQHKNFKGNPSTFRLIFKQNMDESYIVDFSDSTYRFVMDVSGRFMLKVWSEFTQSWMLFFSLPENRCEIYNFVDRLRFAMIKKSFTPVDVYLVLNKNFAKDISLVVV